MVEGSMHGICLKKEIWVQDLEKGSIYWIECRVDLSIIENKIFCSHR